MSLKDKFLTECKGVDYSSRIRAASLYGRNNKESPELGKLIKELRSHPQPGVVEVPAEEGYTDLLPPQRTNIAKHYHDDQLAVAVMISSKTQTQSLIDEVHSPSIFFRKVAAKAVVEQVNDDIQLEKQVLSAVPSTCKVLLHNIIRCRRVALLEKILPILKKEKGIELTASVLHGCSTKLVLQYLQDPLLLHCSTLNWKKIAQYHGDVIVELMKAELASKTKLKRIEVWNEWHGRLSSSTHALHEFYYKGKNAKKIWNLFVTYPSMRFVGSGHSDMDEKDMHSSWIQPIFPKMLKDHLNHILGQCGAEILQWITSTLTVPETPSKVLCSALPDKLLSQENLPWSDFLNYFAAAFKASPSDTLLTESSAVFQIFHNSPQLLKSASTENVISFIETIIKGFANHPTITASKSGQKSYLETMQNLLSNCLRSITTAMETYKKTQIRKIREKDGCISSVVLKPEILKKFEDASLKVLQLLMPIIGRDWTKFSTPNTSTTATTVGSCDDVSWEHVLSVYSSLESFGNFSPKILESIYHYFLPFLQLSKRPDEFFQSSWINIWENVFAAVGLSLIQKLYALITDTKFPVVLSAEEKKSAEKIHQDIFDYILSFWKREPIRQATRLAQLLPYLNVQQGEVVFKTFNFNQLLELAVRLSGDPETTDDLLVRTLLPNFPLKIYQETVAKLLASEQVSEQLRELLQRFRDVSDHGTRKEIVQASDSNSAAVRMQAIQALCVSTLRTPDGPERALQLKRTLTFLRTKIKNEQITNRIDAIRLLFEFDNPNPSKEERYPLLPQTVNNEILQLYYDMLQDALEIQDLDKEPKEDDTPGAKPPVFNSGWREPLSVTSAHQNHPLLKYFFALSQEALLLGGPSASPQDAILFDFGVELQWRMDKFRLGEKDLVKKFRIHLHPSYFLKQRTKTFPEGSEAALVKLVVDAYQKRISERNPKWVDDIEFWKPLYRAVAQKWHTVPALKENIDRFVTNLQAAKKDENGLLIIDGDNSALQLFNHLICIHKNNWWKFDVILLNYMENTIIKSRQAPCVVFQWIAGKEKRCKTIREKKQARDFCVNKLLEVQPSAIYLKIVWRHLVSWHPEKLDPYLNSRKSFRGPFFIEPDQRPEIKRHLPSNKKPKNTVVVKNLTKSQIRTNNFTSRAPGAVTGMLTIVKEEIKKERKMLKDLIPTEKPSATTTTTNTTTTTTVTKTTTSTTAIISVDLNDPNLDHDDFFVLPACFGLTKLLPSQVDKLAQQWKNRMLNDKRSMISRVRSCIRWTEMPTVTYSDIVQFWQSYQKPKNKEAAKKIKSKKAKHEDESYLPVNIVETLLKGVMLSDEPSAPLNFLLSQQFLSSNRARISAYAIAAAIPHIMPSTLTDIMRLVLSGDRQKNLKITAYKEMIRLLAKTPTPAHIDMLNFEWNRSFVHRDLRIELIKAAVLILHQGTTQSTTIGWKIINDTISNQSTWKYIAEMITALLGTYPSDYKNLYKFEKRMFQVPRIILHHKALQKTRLPPTHCQQFANEVIIPLCTAANVQADVKTIALFSLSNFRYYGVNEKTCNLLYQLLADEKGNTLNTTSPGEQATFNSRWRHASDLLLELTGTSQQFKKQPENMASKDWVVKTIGVILDKIDKLGIKQRSKRLHLVSNLTYFAKSIPERGPFQGFFSWNQELMFIEPFKNRGDMWWEYLMARAVAQMTISLKTKEENAPTLDLARSTLHRIFLYGSIHPNMSSIVLKLSQQLLLNISRAAYPGSELSEHVAPLFKLFYTFSLSKPEETKAEPYRILCMHTGLKLLATTGYHQNIISKEVTVISNFLHSCATVAPQKYGFYISGASEISDAIISVIKSQEKSSFLTPAAYESQLTQVLLNLFVDKFAEAGEVTEKSLELVLLKDIVLDLLKKEPLLFAHAKKLCKALHTLIRLCSDKEIPGSYLADSILNLLKSIELSHKNKSGQIRPVQQIPGISHVLFPLLDMTLDSPMAGSLNFNEPATIVKGDDDQVKDTVFTNSSAKSPAYQRVTLTIAVTALTAFPVFAFWRPHCFLRFFNNVINFQTKEVQLLVRPSPKQNVHVLDWLSYVLKKGFYDILRCIDKPSEEDLWYNRSENLIKEFLASPSSSVRFVALNFLQLVGSLSEVKLTESVYNWRNEFEELLSKFRSDKEILLSTIALRVETNVPVPFTECSISFSNSDDVFVAW